MADTVRERGKVWRLLRVWLFGYSRDKTDYERKLEREIEDLRFRLVQKEEEAEQARLNLRKRDADVDAARHEVELLAEVIERDRMRVRAESARFAEKVNRPGSKKQ